MLSSAHIISYNKNELKKQELHCLGDIEKMDNHIHWIDCINGSPEEISEIGDFFNIHPLVIEDIIDEGQMPKLEDYGDYIVLIIKDIDYKIKAEEPLTMEQMTIILKGNTLMSFRKRFSYLDLKIGGKLKEGTMLRKSKGDTLLYTLADIVVDHYFQVLEDMDQGIDDMEDNVLEHPEPDVLEDIYNLKRSLIYMRRTLWPTRNAMNHLTRTDSIQIEEKTIFYFRDLYDHIIQIIDLTETYREICSGLLDTYLSSVSNKTNDIMKVLTVFSTIFIPLTFIAGVYGMNFKYMPELYLKWAYPVFWIISGLITIVMLIYFKKKKWL
ncbi:MAG: magnesium/cobalt transporter CorA [Tissierellia bacterium]|nr:magnesium/cobalt transporter CorA [Tissierellia bacterium]